MMDRSDVGLATYTYDEISQLLTAALPDGDFQTYTFDAVGNRLSLKDQRGLQAYSYDEADELLEVESDFNPSEPDMRPPLMASGSEALSGGRPAAEVEGLSARAGASDAEKPLFKTTYAWDADGNQVGKTGPGNRATSYTFDAMDRLVGVSAPGSEPEKYLYSADRQRVAAVRGKDSVAERFLHLGRGHQVLGDLDGSGKLTKRYIFLVSNQLLASVDTPTGKPGFYHYDALGSTVAISDSSDRIAVRFLYDPYGTSHSIPVTDEIYRYIGRECVYGINVRMLSMGMRAYDPSIGRFLSTDPLRTAQCPDFAGMYAYAKNNPALMIDPNGLDPCKTDYPWNVPPGYACEKYNSGEPTLTSIASYGVCNTTPDSPHANCIRGCLLDDFDPSVGDYGSGFSTAHATCYAACAVPQ